MNCRITYSLYALTFAAIVGTSVAFARKDLSLAAAEPTAAVAPATAGGGDLGGSMQLLQGSVKKVDKAIEKGDMAEVAKLAVEMQKAVAEAKLATPEKAGTISDAKAKAEFVLGYRKQMIALQKGLLELEVHALDGKKDEAKKCFDETIKPMKKEGHGKYKD